MKIKRNKKSYKWFLCGLILVVVLTITYKVSKANYRISNSIELTTGKVVSSPYDFNLISMYIDGVEQSKETIIPESGYAINEEQSYCYKESKSNKDNNARLFTDSLGNHVFKGISKGTKCIIYFDKTKTMEELLNNYYTDKRVRENGTFNQTISGETTRTIFSAPDDNGTSYYFAGNPTDNWVEFGGYYWRIIRINGDGTIRMIYQGRAYDENGKKLEPQAIGEETQIGTSAFNEIDNHYKYVGYWYSNGEGNKGLDLPSNAYIKVNDWFNNSKLKQEQYFIKIDLNNGFCGDRTPSTSKISSNGVLGYSNNDTYYGSLIRLVPGDNWSSSENAKPSYICTDNNDLYTFTISNTGNKKLENPVGLITIDEASYAGVVYGGYKLETPKNNYLYTGQSYWTISPGMYDAGNRCADLLYIHKELFSTINYGNASLVYGVRPTINLKKDVTFTGDGTESNPYKVVV